jgi:hypothetical protein
MADGGVGFRSPGRDAAIAALGQSVGALGLGGALAGMQEAISARCEEEEGGGGDDGSQYSEGGGDGGSEYREGSGDRRPRLTPAAPAAANRRRQQPPPQGAGGVGAAVADALAPFLVKHRLAGAATALRELGAESPADLLDLEEADIAGLELKKLERTRFERALDGLRGRQPAPGSQVAPPATPESLEARCARERRDAHLRAGLATDLGLRARAAVATRAEAGGGAAAATRAGEVVVRSVTDQEFVANPSAHMAAARACLEPRDATNLGKSDSERLFRVLVGVPDLLVNGNAAVRLIKKGLMTTDGLASSLRPPEDLLVAAATTDPPLLGLTLEHYAVKRIDETGGAVTGVAVVEERLFAKQANVTRKFSLVPVPSKQITMASLHYAVEVWEAVMAVAAPFVAGKLRILHRAILIEDRGRCAGVPGRSGGQTTGSNQVEPAGQAPAVGLALYALNTHIRAWAANLEAAAVMSSEEEAGFLTAGVFDATSTFHKTVAAPAAPPSTAAPPGGF